MNVKVLLLYLFYSSIIVIIISCANTNTTPGNSSVMLVFNFSKVYLDDEKLLTRINSAENGCVDSAYILYFHYYTASEFEESIRWLKLAIEGAHPVAIYHNTFDDNGHHWMSSASSAYLSPKEIEYLHTLVNNGDIEAYKRLVRFMAYHQPDKLPITELPETLSGYRFFMDGKGEIKSDREN